MDIQRTTMLAALTGLFLAIVGIATMALTPPAHAASIQDQRNQTTAAA